MAQLALDAVDELELHGRRVAFRQVGSGPVVVLVHGLGATMDVWDGVRDELARSCTVVTLDLPGHGRSDPPPGDYSLGAFACVLRDLLDELRHPAATVVGHSLGGGIAMQFSYQFPERCERLVLVASGGLGAEINPWLRVATLPGTQLVLAVAASRPVTGIRRFISRCLTPVRRRSATPVDPGGRHAAARRHTFVRCLRAVADHRGQRVDATDRLYLLDRTPVLLVWGADDHIIPVEHAHRTNDAMPNSELRIFEGTGHCPHLEDPHRFAVTVRTFVDHTVPTMPP